MFDKAWIVLIVLFISGCAASTGVIPIGNNMYMVSHRDNSINSSLGALKAEAYNEASAYCSKQKKTMKVIKSNDVPRSLGQFPETEVHFVCE